MKTNYEADPETFPENAYRVKNDNAVAWHVLGWETRPDEDTEWTGIENRTGRVVAIMVGDNSRFCFDPEDLEPLVSGEYCGGCGQIGCGHGYTEDE